MPDMKSRLTVKDENFIFYELETNDAFNIYNLSPEEQEKIQANHDEVEEALRQSLVQLVIPNACICQQRVMLERAAAQSRILQPGMSPVIRFEQEDIDNYVFGVVMRSDNGIYRKEPLSIVVWCQTCKSIRFFGDLRPLMRAIGEIYNKEVQSMVVPVGKQPAEVVTPPEAPKFIMKDLTTGEETPANDLAEALFGAGAAGNVSLEEIPAKSDTVEDTNNAVSADEE